MVGSSSASGDLCEKCGGVVLMSSKLKRNKLSLRKSQQDFAHLCACLQPGGSSSSSEKVCLTLPKASATSAAKAHILANVVVTPTFEVISDDEVEIAPLKIQKSAIKVTSKTPAKKRPGKRTADFNKFCDELNANKRKTSTQIEEVRPEIDNCENFNTQTIAAMSTQNFNKAIEENSKFKKMKLQPPAYSLPEQNLALEESFEFEPSGRVACGKEVVSSEAAQQLADLIDELGIEVVSGSERPTSRNSELNTPPVPYLMAALLAPGPSVMLEAAKVVDTPVFTTTSATKQDATVAGVLVDTGVSTVIPSPNIPSNLTVEREIVVAPPVSAISEDEIVVAPPVSTISSSSGDKVNDDDDNATSVQMLTQQCRADVATNIQNLKNRLADIEVAQHSLEELIQRFNNNGEQLAALHQKVSSKAAQIGGGFSGVVLELRESHKKITELSQQQTTVLDEISAKAEQIKHLSAI